MDQRWEVGITGCIALCACGLEVQRRRTYREPDARRSAAYAAPCLAPAADAGVHTSRPWMPHTSRPWSTSLPPALAWSKQFGMWRQLVWTADQPPLWLRSGAAVAEAAAAGRRSTPLSTVEPVVTTQWQTLVAESAEEYQICCTQMTHVSGRPCGCLSMAASHHVVIVLVSWDSSGHAQQRPANVASAKKPIKHLGHVSTARAPLQHSADD